MDKRNVTFEFAAAQRLINAARRADRKITVNGKDYAAVYLIGTGLAHEALDTSLPNILEALARSDVRAVLVGQSEAIFVEDDESDFNLPGTRALFLVEVLDADVIELSHAGEHATSSYCYPADPLGLSLGMCNRPILHLTALPYQPYNGPDLPL